MDEIQKNGHDAMMRYSPSVLGPAECPYNHEHGPWCDDAEALTDAYRALRAEVERMKALALAVRESPCAEGGCGAKIEEHECPEKVAALREALRVARQEIDPDSDPTPIPRREIVSMIDKLLAASPAPAPQKPSDADAYALSASLLGKHGFLKAAEFLYAWANNGAHYCEPSVSGGDDVLAAPQKPEGER